MDTYRILARDVCLKKEKYGSKESARQDFARFLYSAIPAYLTDDLADEVASQLAEVSEREMRDAFNRALTKWRNTCRQSPPATDWDDLSIGDHVYLKSYGWVETIIDVKTIKKEHEDEQVYKVDMLGWYTLSKLKERFYLVEGD